MIKGIGAILFPALMVVGLLISGFVIVTAIQAAPKLSELPTTGGEVAMATQPSLKEQGRALFLSKGCIVCHRNDRAATARDSMMSFGDVPNLTNVKIDADYLRRWLHDPKALKPSTEMPNLNLADGEIEALVRF